MTYYANFNANNCTRLIKPIKDTNKQKIIKSIRDIAEFERFEESECSWSVWYERNGYGYIVAKGGVRRDGTRYRIYDNESFLIED